MNNFNSNCKKKITYNLPTPQVFSNLHVADPHTQHWGQVGHHRKYHIVPKNKCFR